MARPLPITSVFPIQIIPIIYIIFTVLAVFSVFSLVIFLCASHKRQKGEAFSRRKLAISKKKLVSSLSKAGNISSKALLKMVSWRKQVQHGEDEDYQDYEMINHDYVYYDDGYEEKDYAVWKKTIIKGEKCKPLDFSGKIDYDSEGNLLPDKSIDDDQKIIN